MSEIVADVLARQDIAEMREELRKVEEALAWQWWAQQRITNAQRSAQNARLYEQGENPADLDAPGA